MQKLCNSKTDSKKLSSYKTQAPRRAGSQAGAGPGRVIYKEVLRDGSAQPREEKAWGILLAATTKMR